MSEKLEPQNTTQTEGQENAPKDPSKLTFESAFTRRRILAAYWLVILLAIPLWWRYTSISRLSLPESRIQSLAAKQVRHTWSSFASLVYVNLHILTTLTVAFRYPCTCQVKRKGAPCGCSRSRCRKVVEGGSEGVGGSVDRIRDQSESGYLRLPEFTS